MTDEIIIPPLEDRVEALERMVQQQYRVLAIMKGGIEESMQAIQQCRNLIQRLAEAGENVSTDVTNLAELVKIHEKRINAMRNMLEN